MSLNWIEFMFKKSFLEKDHYNRDVLSWQLQETGRKTAQQLLSKAAKEKATEKKKVVITSKKPPIIVVPAALQSLITLHNAKELLENCK